MIYKLRKEIDLNKLSLTMLIDNPHPGVAKIIEENLDNFELEDLQYILQYPHFIDIIIKRLSILGSPYLSKNPNAIHILMKDPKLIDWYMLSTNPSSKALEIIEDNIINELKEIGTKKKLHIQCDQIYSDCHAFWRLLATNTNPKAVEIIEKYYFKLHSLNSESADFWRDLCKNPHAVHLLEKYPSYINWETILENQNAVNIIEKNLNKIYVDDWPFLSGNPNAVHIFEIQEHFNKLYDWSYISKNPNAIHILEKNLDKVEWLSFSQNPKAINIIIEILQEQKDYDHKNRNREDYKYYDYFNKINYTYLSKNPAIFELDYISLKERCDIYRKELIEKTFHPSRIQRLLDLGIEIEDLEIYI